MENDDIADIIRFIVKKTNDRLSRDEKFASQFWKKKKNVLIDITDVGKFAFQVDRNSAVEIDPQTILSPDIYIKSTSRTFIKLISGKVRPMKEMVSGRFEIRASVKDVVLIKKLMFSEENTISGIMNDYRGGL